MKRKMVPLLFFAVITLFFCSCDSEAPPEDSPAENTQITQNMTKREITISRGQFNIREGGNLDGIPVVMIHGWPESSYCWEGVAAYLDPSFHLIAPDLRGLGDSERTLGNKAYRKTELAKDVIEIINQLNIDSFYLVGHDWGGTVAQLMARMIPNRVDRLVIMNIPVINNSTGSLAAARVLSESDSNPLWYQNFQRIPGMPEAFIPGNEEAWIRQFYKDRPVPPEAIDEYIRCYKIENTPTTGAAYYRSAMGDAISMTGYMDGKFTMPALYIHGRLDSVIVPEFLEGIEDSFVSVTVESLETSHFVQEEKPREVAELMNEFFGK